MSRFCVDIKPERFEIRSTIKIQMFKIRGSSKLNCMKQKLFDLDHWGFGHWNVFRISILEFRIFSQALRLIGWRRNFTRLFFVMFFSLSILTMAIGGEIETPDSHATAQTGEMYSSDDSNADRSKEGGSRWVHWERLNVFVIVGIFFMFVLIFTKWAKRGRELRVKDMAGIQAVGQAIERASEIGKPVVYVPGVFDVDNIQTIASMAILVHVAKKAAEKGVRLIVPLNRAFLIPLAEESVKKGMDAAGRIDRYDPDNIRYLSDDQFAYAAAVDGIMLREKPAASFYLGGFGAEALILTEIGYSVGAVQIAGTAETQQLPFIVPTCDHTLIGEEFYAASAYISKESKLLGTLKAADVVKAGIIALLLLGSILELFGIHTITGWFLVQ
jgi:hypothetical protein